MSTRIWDKKRIVERQLDRSFVKVKDLDGEVWKPISGFDGYMVSNLARIKRLGRVQPNVHNTKSIRGEKLLKYSSKKEYPHVPLFIGQERKYKLVHRLVAEAFIPNPHNKPEVNHIHGKERGHGVDNLEWATKSENESHAHRAGLKTGIRGERNWNCKLTSKQVNEIRQKYIPRIYTEKILALEYGVSQSHIHGIIKNKDRIYG